MKDETKASIDRAAKELAMQDGLTAEQWEEAPYVWASFRRLAQRVIAAYEDCE